MSKWHDTVGSVLLCVYVLPSHFVSTVSGEPANAYAESARRTLYGGTFASSPCESAPGTPTTIVFTGAAAASCAFFRRSTIVSGCSQSLQPLPSVYPGRVETDAHDAPPSVT